MTQHRVTAYQNAEATLKIPTLMQALYDADPIFLPQTVVCLHGDAHREKRKAVLSVFTRDFFRDYQNRVFPGALAESLAPVQAAGRGDMVQFAYRVLVNLVADSAGIDRAHTEEDTDRILRLIGGLAKAPTMGQMVAGDRDAALARIEAALEEFERDFYTPSAARRQALIDAGGDTPHDMLTALLRTYPDGKLSRDVLVKDAAFFILAGAFTTGNVLMHTVNDVLTWCRDHPGTRGQLLADPGLLQKFVWEAIRLHPASPVSRRKPTGPVNVPGGAEAVPGDLVEVDIMEANRNPDVFGPDADRFNPYRELSSRVPLTGISFGAGPHACPGRILAGGLKITPDNINSDETEFGTIHLVVQALLRAGIDLDPDNPAVIDETTTRRHLHALPFVLRPDLAVGA